VKISHLAPLLAAVFLLLMVTAITADAPQANKGNLCEVIVRPTKISNHYEFEIVLTNDQPIAAMALPFAITAGKNSINYASISFAGSRAAFCAAKIPNVDSANQRINLGLLASLAPPMRYIDPGTGTIAKLYYTVSNGTRLEDIKVDTTFFPPSNHLMAVPPDAKNNIKPDFKFSVIKD